MSLLTRRSFTLAIGASALAAPAAIAQANSPLVFAAASLQDVLPQVGAELTRTRSVPVRYAFGASSALARQIEQGAPADVFISADLDWMDYLDQRNLIARPSRRNLLSNQLVLIAPATSSARIRIGRNMPLAQALGSGRLALADPASVPAGRYAQAALTSLGIWSQVAGKVAPADNVRGALAFVARGEAPFGIVYATDARAEPRVRVVGVFPETSHPPILYPGALCTHGREAQAGTLFLGFLQSPAATRFFRQAGFGVRPRPG
jgi:molybdate transport system substrate-binding protein